METFEATYGGPYEYPTVAGADGGATMAYDYYQAGIYEGYVPTMVLVAPTTREVLYAESGGKTEAGFTTLLDTYNVPSQVTPVASAPKVASAQLVKSVSSKGITFAAEARGEYNVVLYSVSGKVLMQETVSINSGIKSLSFEGRNFSHQVITAVISHGNTKVSRTFVVQ